MNGFFALVHRDVSLALRQGGGGGIGIGFFVLTVVLVPLGVGSDADVLARIAGGVIWIAALLAALLSLDRLFQADFEDASLDQLMLSPMPLEQVVLAKAVAHWVTTGLPMLLTAPVLGIMLSLPGDAILILMLGLAVGTPTLSFLGAIGAAITVGVRRGGLLLSILVLPLYVPTLIYGARAVEHALLDLPVTSSLALTGAITLLSAALTPFAAAAALRINAQ